MNEQLPEPIVEAFGSLAQTALEVFPVTTWQCVGLSAWIANQLNTEGVGCKVALGSLRCNNILAFKYVRPVPKRPKKSFNWDGHAWVEFEGNIIGDASLCRTARESPSASNMRNHLEHIGALHLGALMFTYSKARNSHGLKYSRKSYLHDEAYNTVIEALERINANHEA